MESQGNAASAASSAVINYVASPTLARFHASPAFVRCVRGPAGSGKSVGTGVMETLRLAMMQPKQSDGVRRSRTLVVRNTYPDLLNTTVRTFEDWLPPQVFTMKRSPPITAMLVMETPQYGRVEIEYDFLSADDEKRVRQLKSYECSNAYLNELGELPRSVFDAVGRAVGRYPRVADGGVTRPCIVADTNACDTDHWLYHMAEVEKPADFAMFAQPSAMLVIGKRDDGRLLYAPNPRAENIPNLQGGYDYYRRMMVGKRDQWIRVFVLNEYGDTQQGRPCFPEFGDIHVVQSIPVLRGLGLRLCWDYGRTPACGIFQVSPEGQFRALKELYVDPAGVGMALETFVRQVVRPYLEAHYPGLPIIQSVGDPAGASGGQAQELSCEDVLSLNGLPTVSAPSNDPEARLQAVSSRLMGRVSGGQPAMIVSAEGCPFSLQGFRGKYQFERRRVGGADGLYKDAPVKNHVSHIMDAWGYGALGAHAQAITAKHTKARPVQAPTRYGT